MADRDDYDRAEFTTWLAASCERQGVPLTITDPTVIAQVATVVGAGTKRHHCFRDRLAQRDAAAAS
ncbi:Uncharacterised protein [Mycobacteroides abscessus subsp. bolletii]|nr:Uncharacterised protein [Mycobacteroides abscessus subsp. bolletii]SKQ45469.1 Uncharacterised protein [Mycobacteroides abscessus subsp. bolletii]SKQ47645.1 Uncharacterised protein [Mycobacteroides abscessus subsp. bolletii]SKQ50212.1 Uncharacterised protein [Mycobacteroides abscessus subsp. bolletii]